MIALSRNSTDRIYAELSVTYNGNQRSNFAASREGSEKYDYLSYYLPMAQNTLVAAKQKIFSWELPPMGGDMDILTWGPRPTRMYVPEMCVRTIDFFSARFGAPQLEKAVGYLNPGGRTVFILPEAGESFSLKLDTSGENILPIENQKPLSKNFIASSLFNSRYLSGSNRYASEDEAVSLQLDGHRYGYILRRDRLKKSWLRREFMVPAYCFFSDIFWANNDLLYKMRLPSGRDRLITADWIVTNFSEVLFAFLREALFNTYLHPEVHQQNLICKVRGGRIVQSQYHDHLDCLWDPVSYVLRAIGREEESITQQWLYLLNAGPFQGLGLVPSSNQENTRPVISLGSWWRRWLRSFGQYDRWLNIYAHQNPWRENDIEKLVNEKLRTEALKLFGVSAPELDQYLYKNIEKLNEFSQKALWQTAESLLMREKINMQEALSIVFSGAGFRSYAGAGSPLVREYYEHRIGEGWAAWRLTVAEGAKLILLKNANKQNLYFCVDKKERG